MNDLMFHGQHHAWILGHPHSLVNPRPPPPPPPPLLFTIICFLLSFWTTLQLSPLPSFDKFTIEVMNPSQTPTGDSGERDHNLIFYIIHCFLIVHHNI